MSASDKYGQLRDRCLRYWNMHPDVSGSVADLWHRSANRFAEISAAALFGDAADLIDIQRREIESLERLTRKVKAAVEELNAANDDRGTE